MNNFPRFLDKNYLRLPTHLKKPLRKDWSLPINQYYKEPLTILQLLKKYQEYGIRLGLFVKKNYHLAALYFRTSNLIPYTNLFPTISYTQTENGLYYFLLLKELPPNGLLKDLNGNPLGNFYGSGKLVIGPSSLINNYRYFFINRPQDYLTFNSLVELLNCLLKLNLKLEIQGSLEFNPNQNEWYCPAKLKARWKKRNFAKAKLTREKQLTNCLDCSRKIKQVNLTNHLLKIHQRKLKKSKPLRTCGRCHLTYSTLLKSQEHRQFYCPKNYQVAKTKLNYEKPPNLKSKFKLSSNGFPLPLKAKCFKCSKSFLIKFVIPRQDYSQKNSWNYWTGQKGNQKICDACLREFYYDKLTYWKTVKDLKKRQQMRTYIYHRIIS